MYDEIVEIAENKAYLNAVRNETYGPNLDLLRRFPAYSSLADYENELRQQDKLTFSQIFHEPIGYYLLKCFLIADYSVDKAVFISDCELFKKMRDPSARLKLAKLIFERFVADDGAKYPMGESVFERRRKRRALGQRNTLTDGLSDPDEGSLNKLSLQIGKTNAIGVYGKAVNDARERLAKGDAPKTLFDEIAQEVLNDLRLDVFPRFSNSEFFEKYIRAKSLERIEVTHKDFTMLRVLGRGAFGAVTACVKNDTGKLYAAKCIDKRRVMATDAVDSIMSERNLLAMMDSNFVCCLKYAVQDNDTLYLMLDLMMGGDLKYHLNKEVVFSETRSRFHAAEILLGLEHLHSKDVKLENVLLDEKGHCRISDLGLAVLTKGRVKGYAGTPGYTAPEVIVMQPYDKACDFFSYGVMVYRFLSGKKPFGPHTGSTDLDKNVLNAEVEYSDEYFSSTAKSLLQGLLQKDPTQRLGVRGIDEIKQHPWFDSVDWGLLEAGYLSPPFVPKLDEVNAESMRHMGRSTNDEKYRKVRLTDEFQKSLSNFPFKSYHALQREIVEVLERADEGVNFEKFAPKPPAPEPDVKPRSTGCCSLQ
ncbi:hypothetical protein PBRA_009421 [Plasmodiophora brassicae]|uniref:G protein-coupled receptor kinase n=1 Tax=Plasmodiophora brassicae TaxID=37360 RepID=A0A0G4J8B7_PLABS|nr:hypothetical protein PBRA_009421 [Plasmodiophora brassicae]